MATFGFLEALLDFAEKNDVRPSRFLICYFGDFFLVIYPKKNVLLQFVVGYAIIWHMLTGLVSITSSPLVTVRADMFRLRRSASSRSCIGSWTLREKRRDGHWDYCEKKL